MTHSANCSVPRRRGKIVNEYAGGADIVGAAGGLVDSGADLAAIAPIWTCRTRVLADGAGAAFEAENARKLTLAEATDVVSLVDGIKTAAPALGRIGAMFTSEALLALGAAQEYTS